MFLFIPLMHKLLLLVFQLQIHDLTACFLGCKIFLCASFFFLAVVKTSSSPIFLKKFKGLQKLKSN
jgi:hypothetical protein